MAQSNPNYEALLVCCSIPIGIFFIVFWFVQLFDLMNAKDAAFPGKHDKLIWAFIILFLSIVGALIFWAWKQGTVARSLLPEENLSRTKQLDQQMNN